MVNVGLVTFGDALINRACSSRRRPPTQKFAKSPANLHETFEKLSFPEIHRPDVTASSDNVPFMVLFLVQKKEKGLHLGHHLKLTQLTTLNKKCTITMVTIHAMIRLCLQSPHICKPSGATSPIPRSW